MKKVLLSLFIIFPICLSLFIFFYGDKSFSDNENRNLKTKNDIKLNVLDGDFQNDAEEYLSDQFPFRDTLKFAENEILFKLGKREIGGAYIGKDMRLFEKKTADEDSLNKLYSYADKIEKLSQKSDADVYVMLVPSAGAALSDSLPNGAPFYNYNEVYEGVKTHLKTAKTVDVLPALNTENSYYYTDHHWTAEGAYKAYSCFCKEKGESAKDISYFKLKIVSDNFKGTLYSKALINEVPCDTIEISEIYSNLDVVADSKKTEFYNYDALKTKDKYNVFQGGNHGIVEITNKEVNNNKTLLVLKDSFANSFLQFVCCDYEKIVVVDERYAFIDVFSFESELNPSDVLVLREIL